MRIIYLSKKLVYLLIISFLFPYFTFAQSPYATVPNQEINITINSDYTAKGIWNIPMLLPMGVNQIKLPEFWSYGSANSTRYVLNGVTNDNKEKVSISRVNDQTFAFSPSASDLKKNSLAHANYTLYPAFTQPVAVYEFWIDDGLYRQNPTMNINFPKNWKVLTYWPDELVFSGNKINLVYPIKYLDVKPIIVVFQTNGSGVVEKFGKYTVSGSKDQVKKMKDALGKLSFVDDEMMQTIGAKTPDKILVVIDDMTKASSLGYEVDALVTRPNLVIFNSQFLNNKTSNEIAEIIAHELLHLVMFQQNLFQNREYYAPWFDEGLAVFFQIQAHNKIFTDPVEKILNEELDRTNIVSPKEAVSLYESRFDYEFDGSRDLGTIASYKHAGIVFSNFYNKKGLNGFKDLFKSLAVSNTQPNIDSQTDQIKSLLKSISGLSEKDLLYPGKSDNTVTQLISKIERPENDEDKSAQIVTNYIKNNIKHYFSSKQTTTNISTSVTKIKK